jgi:hypothetical protein
MAQEPARTAPEALAAVKRAAEITGVSGFIVAAAQEAANRTIEETLIARLSIESARLRRSDPQAAASVFRLGGCGRRLPEAHQGVAVTQGFRIEVLTSVHARRSFSISISGSGASRANQHRYSCRLPRPCKP